MSKVRLEEMDILRGLSVGGMFFVITPGSWKFRFPLLEKYA